MTNLGCFRFGRPLTGQSTFLGSTRSNFNMPERERLEREEKEGLLSGATFPEKLDSDQQHLPSWSRKSLLAISFSFLGFLLVLVTGPRCWASVNSTDGNTDGKQQTILNSLLLSNGTHDFKSTVLMVSIDGLRADYLDRGLTPHLLEISRVGLRAKWMMPIFPVKSAP